MNMIILKSAKLNVSMDFRVPSRGLSKSFLSYLKGVSLLRYLKLALGMQLKTTENKF